MYDEYTTFPNLHFCFGSLIKDIKGKISSQGSDIWIFEYVTNRILELFRIDIWYYCMVYRDQKPTANIYLSRIFSCPLRQDVNLFTFLNAMWRRWVDITFFPSDFFSFDATFLLSCKYTVGPDFYSKFCSLENWNFEIRVKVQACFKSPSSALLIARCILRLEKLIWVPCVESSVILNSA